MAATVVLLIIVGVVDLFFYPLKSAKPNFSDVERVFNKIVVPADWVEISSSENRGIAGRACPIESSGCFGKSKRFSLDPGTPVENIEHVYESSGCPNASATEDNQSGGVAPIRFLCSIDGLTVGGDYYRDLKEISVHVRSY